MIYIEEIAEKLQNILNGLDEETSGTTLYSDFYFDVQVAGYHIDHIQNKNIGKNFIPVFIDLMGGEYDPIPNLKKGSFNIPITFYFPVRFKNEFYHLNEFLNDVFVGKVLSWGANTGLCLSTISVATYGEIQDLDLKEFKTWAENKYQRELEVMEPFRSMDLTLYLLTGEGLIYSNQVEYSMAYTYEGIRYPEEGYYRVKWLETSSGISNDPISQQLIGTKHTESVINITNRSHSILVYAEDNDFWKNIITAYNNDKMNDLLATLEIKKVYKRGSSEIASVTKNASELALSITENLELGSPLSYSFTFGDKWNG